MRSRDRRRRGLVIHCENIVDGHSTVKVPLSYKICHRTYAVWIKGLQDCGHQLIQGSKDALLFLRWSESKDRQRQFSDWKLIWRIISLRLLYSSSGFASSCSHAWVTKWTKGALRTMGTQSHKVTYNAQSTTEYFFLETSAESWRLPARFQVGFLSLTECRHVY